LSPRQSWLSGEDEDLKEGPDDSSFAFLWSTTTHADLSPNSAALPDRQPTLPDRRATAFTKPGS